MEWRLAFSAKAGEAASVAAARTIMAAVLPWAAHSIVCPSLLWPCLGLRGLSRRAAEKGSWKFAEEKGPRPQIGGALACGRQTGLLPGRGRPLIVARCALPARHDQLLQRVR